MGQTLTHNYAGDSYVRAITISVGRIRVIVPEDGAMSETGSLTEAQRRVVIEIQRVAAELGVDRLSQNDFDRHHRLACVTTAGYQFGSWNEAVKAAGLDPIPPGMSNRGSKISDEE